MEKLLTKTRRKEIFEKTCRRFHDDGVKRLRTVGHFEKYLPCFHYRLCEPSADSPHIFVTELFGRNGMFGNLLDKMGRIQYHGNFDGVQRVLFTSIHNCMFEPFNGVSDIPTHDLSGENTDWRSGGVKELLLSDLEEISGESVSYHPGFESWGKGRGVADEARAEFDKSLLYLDHMLKFITPNSMRTNVGSEQISNTYHVL
jgi:hypothetical protein